MLVLLVPTRAYTPSKALSGDLSFVTRCGFPSGSLGDPGQPPKVAAAQGADSLCQLPCALLPIVAASARLPPPRRPGPTSLLRSPPRMSLLQRFSCLLRGGRSSGARFYPLLALRPLLPLRPEAHAARSRRQLKSCGILGKEEKERHLLRTYDPTVASGGFCCGLTT